LLTLSLKIVGSIAQAGLNKAVHGRCCCSPGIAFQRSNPLYWWPPWGTPCGGEGWWGVACQSDLTSPL